MEESLKSRAVYVYRVRASTEDDPIAVRDSHDDLIRLVLPLSEHSSLTCIGGTTFDYGILMIDMTKDVAIRLVEKIHGVVGQVVDRPVASKDGPIKVELIPGSVTPLSMTVVLSPELPAKLDYTYLCLRMSETLARELVQVLKSSA